MNDRRQEDNGTRIAHEIEARLHHGERANSVIHDELHKLQRLDTQGGVVDHDKFRQDVRRVEDKLHKDGFLPNLHLKVDGLNHVHLVDKRIQSSDRVSTGQVDNFCKPQPPYGQRQTLDMPPLRYPELKQNGFPPLRNFDPSFGTQDLIPQRKDQIPYRQDQVPYRQDQVPYRQDRVPYRQDQVPYRQDRVPYRQDQVPYLQDRVPYRQDQVPYLQDRVPYRQDQVPYLQDRVPYRQDQGSYRPDHIPFRQERIPYRQDQPFLRNPDSERFDKRQRQDMNFAPIKTEGDFKELRLENRSSNHAGADALVYVRKDFDPSKPVHLVVYNHGWGSTVSSALERNKIKEMMSNAQANTVLLLPEWQATPGARNSNTGAFSQQNKFTNMVQEAMQKTPALRGASLANIDKIDIIAHSAGYSPTQTELYKNPAIASKVHSITLLDSLYNQHAFDKWIGQNIEDLASGRKQFYNFSNTTTNANSRAQANFVASMLRSRGLPTDNYLTDYNKGRDEVSRHGAEMSRRSIVFATTDVGHSAIPSKYIGATLRALNPERYNQKNTY